MKGKTHSTEEIIRILRQPMAVKPPNQVAVRTNSQSKRSVAEKKYGDMELADAKRLKEL